MPRPKSTGLPREEEERYRRGLLLEVAAQVFIEQGYAGTSLNDIVRRAKASKQTFYRRFSNKEQLFLAVIEHRTVNLPNVFRGVFEKKRPIRAALTDLAATLQSFVLSDAYVGLARIVYMEAMRFPEAARTLQERGPNRGIGFVSQFLREQSRAGILPIKDPLLAARQFGGLVLNDSLHRRLLGLRSAPTEKEIKVVSKAAVNAFLTIYARGS